MVKSNLIKVVDHPKEKEFKMEDCDTCAVAKASRLTFGNTSIRGLKPLEIIHSDIAGPLKPSMDGSIYYITFIDNSTGFVMVYPLKSKTAIDVLHSYKLFESMSERTLDRKINLLRTDGGNEYLGVMSIYLKSKGIVHQVTTPYTPQLNGVAERWNRTLKEMTALMLIRSNLDMRYWVHAITYANQLLNMGRTYWDKSIYKIMLKRKPIFANIHEFGATGWL